MSRLTPAQLAARNSLEDIGHAFLDACKIVRAEKARIEAAAAAREAERERNRQLLAAWTHPAGTPVVVTLDDGTPWETATRSRAWALGHGEPVVSLEGRTGGYALERVRVREGAVT